jgi:hypothetical protein
VAEVLGSRGQSEREGERAGQRAQMEEGRWASKARGSKGARGLGHGQKTCGRGCVHDGEIVGERLGTTDRWGRRDRERERAGVAESNGADRIGPRDIERGRERALRVAPTGLAHGTEREGESGRSGLRRQAGPACQAEGRAGAGLTGLPWAQFLFPFSWNFYCLFYLVSLGFSIQIQIKFQIQTKSSMCNNSKNIWGST